MGGVAAQKAGGSGVEKRGSSSSACPRVKRSRVRANRILKIVSIVSSRKRNDPVYSVRRLAALPGSPSLAAIFLYSPRSMGCRP